MRLMPLEQHDIGEFERAQDIVGRFADLERRILPSNVREEDRGLNSARYTVRLDGVVLVVIVSVECIAHELWAHLSMSAARPARIPLWSELGWAKDMFLGAERKAIQVLPPKAEYVNHHPHVLHLFCPLERDPLPDFRRPDSSGTLTI